MRPAGCSLGAVAAVVAGSFVSITAVRAMWLGDGGRSSPPATTPHGTARPPPSPPRVLPSRRGRHRPALTRPARLGSARLGSARTVQCPATDDAFDKVGSEIRTQAETEAETEAGIEAETKAGDETETETEGGGYDS